MISKSAANIVSLWGGKFVEENYVCRHMFHVLSRTGGGQRSMIYI